MEPYQKIARILRADKDYLRVVDERLGEVTGKKGVMAKLVKDNDGLVGERLRRLRLKRKGLKAKKVYDALIERVRKDDEQFAQSLGNPVCDSVEGCNKTLDAVREVAGVRTGFFLKHEKAREFLVGEPPRKVMEYLGYSSVEAMLKKEDLLEVYSALRFVEGSEFLNKTFFKQYAMLTPDDFEEREVVVHVLDPKWVKVTRSFVKKKWHNISHLKELGVVFVIPISLGIPGELLRMSALVFHYLHEIPFYSDMFRDIAEDRNTFTYHLTSLLRGDVIDHPMPQSDRSVWLVIQQYLAKHDEFDWRLHVPHINPEAMHWMRAERDLAKLKLSFWDGLDWVGDFFKDDVGNDTLVSFDLVDVVMSLVQEKEMIKYLYHHQEALWNEIFVRYFGEEQLERYCKEYLLQGYFEV
jgi:hypothetical protein